MSGARYYEKNKGFQSTRSRSLYEIIGPVTVTTGAISILRLLRILQRGTKLPMVFNVLRDPYEIGQLKLDFTMEIAIFLLSN